MKTKIYAFVFLCAGMLCMQQVEAQCATNYIDKIYQNVTTVTDTYSTANSTTLLVDIYQPTGDVSTMRPLIILAHGGSFIGGNRTDDGAVTALCTSFAKRGYVTASIEYRLGQAFDMFSAPSAKDVVMKAISDGKAAIRFFRKDAATANKYRINPDRIFVGGNSAGAVLYAHSVYIDSVNEAPSDLRTIINNNGGLEGNSGNVGYSSAALALINLAGGLNQANFLSPGNTPAFSAQGDADNTVPYHCANAQSGLTPVQLCGLGEMEPLFVQYGINHSSIVYPGEGHCPWLNNNAEMTQIDSSSAAFLAPYACNGVAASIGNVNAPASISIYPNPATSEVNLQGSDRISMVSVFNNLGQVVYSNMVENTTGKINTTEFAKGVYTVRIEFADKNIATASKILTIE